MVNRRRLIASLFGISAASVADVAVKPATGTRSVPVFTLPSTYSQEDVAEAIKLIRDWFSGSDKSGIVLPFGCSLTWQQFEYGPGFGNVRYVIQQAPQQVKPLHVKIIGREQGAQHIAKLINEYATKHGLKRKVV